MVVVLAGLFSCDLLNELDPKSESEKRVELLTKGGTWKVDSLIGKTDVFNGGVSTITSEEIFLNHGTLEFQSPENKDNPGYNAGYAIHTYTLDGIAHVDTLAWVPYNFNSGSDNHITIFYSEPNADDFVVNAYDMYFDILTFENNKVRIESWRREEIVGGGGTSYGTFRRYHLTR
jgi:hypothetical protein